MESESVVNEAVENEGLNLLIRPAYVAIERFLRVEPWIDGDDPQELKQLRAEQLKLMTQLQTYASLQGVVGGDLESRTRIVLAVDEWLTHGQNPFRELKPAGATLTPRELIVGTEEHFETKLPEASRDLTSLILKAKELSDYETSQQPDAKMDEYFAESFTAQAIAREVDWGPEKSPIRGLLGRIARRASKKAPSL